MFNKLYSAVFVVISLGIFGSAHAVPVLLDETSFNANISGLAVQVEDFEGITAGVYASPFTFANGTYSATADAAVQSGSLFCVTGQCLTNQNIIGPKTFDSLAADTLYWGTDFYNILGASDPFQVTVVGGSGTGVFSGNGSHNGFWGFYDALGIQSITFENLGINGGYINYSFDNITTASLSSVPEPGSLGLLGLAMVIAGLMMRRKRSLLI